MWYVIVGLLPEIWIVKVSTLPATTEVTVACPLMNTPLFSAPPPPATLRPLMYMSCTFGMVGGDAGLGLPVSDAYSTEVLSSAVGSCRGWLTTWKLPWFWMIELQSAGLDGADGIQCGFDAVHTSLVKMAFGLPD